MPAPYSPDLRRRVLHACAMVEGSRAEIARRFQVSERSVYLWLRQEREEGRMTPKPDAGGRASRFDAALIRTLYEAQPDVTLAECAARYERRGPACRSASRVSSGWSRRWICGERRKTLHAIEQERPDVVAARETFRANGSGPW